MMSQDTKSLNAAPKPEPKDGASPEAADPAAGPVELTAMVKYTLLEPMLTRSGRESIK